MDVEQTYFDRENDVLNKAFGSKKGTGGKRVCLYQNFGSKRRIINENIYSKKKKRPVPEFVY